MSYWVYLEDENEKTLEVENHTEGGTYAMGGTNEAELNITYNYCKFYYPLIDKDNGIQYINGKKAKDVINRLENTVDKLGTKRDLDYWKPTEGNAGFAINILLGWAKEHPEGIFRVS